VGTSSPETLGRSAGKARVGCRKNTQGHKPFLQIAVVASAVAAVAVKLKSQQTTSFGENLQL
jgi:hypothetical protein